MNTPHSQNYRNTPFIPLSQDFVVAIEIYKATQLNKPIGFTQLVKQLDGKVSKCEISTSLDTLCDWGIIIGGYGILNPDREDGQVKHTGYGFIIAKDHMYRMSLLCELYEIDDKHIGENNEPPKHEMT